MQKDHDDAMEVESTKEAELRQEINKLREEIANANDLAASKMRESNANVDDNMVDSRLVNQLLIAFLKLGQQQGDNGRREVIETMSRVLKWDDQQKREVLKEYPEASFSTASRKVVSRGWDLLAPVVTSSTSSSDSSKEGKRKGITTEAAAKMLENESFEELFLKEFLANESSVDDSSTKRSKKVVEPSPATPLSSRAVGQTMSFFSSAARSSQDSTPVMMDPTVAVAQLNSPPPIISKPAESESITQPPPISKVEETEPAPVLEE